MTTWLWNLHSTPHDFSLSSKPSNSATAFYPNSSISRKVISSGLAHCAVILAWISGMLFHTAYYSNYMEWSLDPIHVKPSAHLIWPLVGQEILNSDLGGYFQGLRITSGLFNVWRASGLISSTLIKYACASSIAAALLLLFLSFLVMHLYPMKAFNKLIYPYNYAILLGLASISWCAHLVHIALPLNLLIDSGVSPSVIGLPSDLLSRDVIQGVYPEFGHLAYSSSLPLTSLSYTSLSPSSGALPLVLSVYHHFALGLVLMLSGLLASGLRARRPSTYLRTSASTLYSSWHSQLSLALLLVSTLSFVQAHVLYSVPVYPYLSSDYAAQVSLYTHHMWIGGFLMIGHGAHASICVIQDGGISSLSKTKVYLYYIFAHRDLILGHLSWVVIFLGLHSFGIFLHNDSLEALSRPEDLFSDTSIQLRPLFSSISGIFSQSASTSLCYIVSLNHKILESSVSLGTSDFMVYHIHAFTLHTSALILVKGIMFSRSSRLLSDKASLGFLYPCDGPGRGGTCQISSWDHFFLSMFWMYNSISVIIFHFYWKNQSDLWGFIQTDTSQTLKISHITSGDFSSNSNSVNGWLRSFLWSQSAQVIQSYSGCFSGYGLIFLASHLLWAFSLMFLYSGRGYWQEFIESVVWAHYKLRFIPQIQPRALSISQGRAVGVAHYLLGGIGCTWSFFISRMVSLSY